MNLKKVIRKVAAVGAGMTMVGATLMGALAANLNEYPAPFVADGAFDAVLVVGDNAAPVDIIGVTDVAMALQYGMTTTEAVASESSTTTVSDGKVEDDLTLGYNPFSAAQTYNDGDITVLKDDKVRYESADVNYKEIIGFAADTFIAETGEADEDFGTDVYLTANADEIYYRWQPDSPLDANFTADTDLDISFLGMDFQITGVGTNEVTLASANEVWMNKGESMTVTVSGEEYTI
ncbi:hypothetical protein ISS04_04230, partial [Candidatus Woesearchaeota archaeon]|nr:hypothetical protein [Candidatus Woesearchaeota archaeon]